MTTNGKQSRFPNCPVTFRACLENKPTAKILATRLALQREGVGLALAGEPDDLDFNPAFSITDVAESHNIFGLWFLTFPFS